MAASLIFLTPGDLPGVMETASSHAGTPLVHAMPELTQAPAKHDAIFNLDGTPLPG